jgi:hypothetical protein
VGRREKICGVSHLALALLAAGAVSALVVVDVRRGDVAGAAQRSVALCLALTFGLVEQPLGLLDISSARVIPGVVGALATIDIVRAALESVAVVAVLWLITVGSALAAAVSSGRRARAALAIAAGAAVVIGALSRGAFQSSYHQGLVPIALAALFVVADVPGAGEADKTRRGDDAVWLVIAVLATVYAASAVAKMRALGGEFGAPEHQLKLIAECLVQHCNYLTGPLAAPLLRSQADAAAPTALLSGWPTLVFELGFVLSLASTRATRMLAMIALAFHAFIVLALGIVFVEFVVLNVLVVATAARRPLAPSRRARALSAGVVAVTAVCVALSVKFWPLSGFPLFAHDPGDTIVVDDIIADGAAAPLWLPDVMPAHAVASPRRWLAGCFGAPGDVARCEVWLAAIAARTNARELVVERRITTWRDIGRGARAAPVAVHRFAAAP